MMKLMRRCHDAAAVAGALAGEQGRRRRGARGRRRHPADDRSRRGRLGRPRASPTDDEDGNSDEEDDEQRYQTDDDDRQQRRAVETVKTRPETRPSATCAQPTRQPSSSSCRCGTPVQRSREDTGVSGKTQAD